MKDLLVGIDFGACNLKAVKIKNDGSFEAVELSRNNMGQDKHAANLIYYNKTKEGNINKIIGEEALNRRKTDKKGKNYIDNIKRRLENPVWSKNIANLDNRAVTAAEAAGDIFSVLRSKYIVPKSGQNIRAAITVPVCYTPKQRQIIRQVAEQTGFQVDLIISEPFAALLSLADLAEQAEQREQLILIFDFGGSTLDFSVAQVTNYDEKLCIKELAAQGIKLGGLDIDRDIYEHILRPQYADILDKAPVGSDPIEREENFLRFAQALKETLFKSGDTSAIANEMDNEYPEGCENIELKLTDLNAMLQNGDYARQIRQVLDDLFTDLFDNHCYDKSDLTKVWVFGGTAQIPYFVDLLTDYFGETLLSGNDFENYDILLPGLESRYMAVAGGAVNYLNLCLDESNTVEIENIIPFVIGYAQNGKFIPCLDMLKPMLFKIEPILSLEFLNETGWSLDFYQTTSGKASAQLDEANGEEVFLGKIQLDTSLYSQKSAVKMEMQMVREPEELNKRRLRLRFVEERSEDGVREPVMVEEYFMTVGG